jgi:hypothetical protein
VALGAALLLVSLFLNWYQPGRSAWEVFEVWDLVLAALSVMALVAAAGRLGVTQRRPDRWLITPGGTAFVVVVASLVNHPPGEIRSDPMVGIWLGLAASILMLIGAVVAVARVSVAIKLEDRPVADPQSDVPKPAGRRRFPSSPRAGATGSAERADSAVAADEGTHPTRVLGGRDPSSPETPTGRP